MAIDKFIKSQPATLFWKQEACPGFTLFEVLIILVILGFLVSMMPRVFGRTINQKRFEETLQRVEEIKKAILGLPGKYHVEGGKQFAGYIPDMGALPALVDVLGTPSDPADDQPKALWDQGDQSSAYLVSRQYVITGWRGPYIEKPEGGVFRDAWGSPFVFKDFTTHPAEIPEGDLLIESWGADGENDPAGESGSGLDKDIILTIRKCEYLARVAGQAGEGISKISVSFNRMGSRVWDENITGLEEGDCFCFGGRVEGEPEIPSHGRNYCDIPAGRVFVKPMARSETSGNFHHKGAYHHPVYLRPGLNWLGRMY